MGLLDSYGYGDDEQQDQEKDARVLDAALEILAHYEHQQHSVLNAAAASPDLLVKARAVVDVSSAAEPGKFVDAQDRAAVTRGATLAGKLLAAQPTPVADAIA